ncbi:hypothetical protein [Candidatus Uabimicrobium amorphum]|nr:hypothetical protein [Candidatus Uabimicrobium amorphum]
MRYQLVNIRYHRSLNVDTIECCSNKFGGYAIYFSQPITGFPVDEEFCN